MARNQMLTGIIKGRELQTIVQEGQMARLEFVDGSIMTVRVAAGHAAMTPENGVIAAVRQAGTTLQIDMEGGETLTLQTAESTSSVMLRDGNGTFEYSD